MNNEQTINNEETISNEQANTEQANNEPANIEQAKNGIVMTQAQVDLQTALESIMESINKTLTRADNMAFRFAYDIKRVYDLITEYRHGTKDPFYYNSMRFTKVEEFAKQVFGLSKSAFLSKVKVASEFCNINGLPDPTKTKGLKYSALQDVTADEIAALEKKYNALKVSDGKEKPSFSELSLKSIRALKNATHIAIEKGSIIDASKILPGETKPEKESKKSGTPDSTEKESGINAREKALNAVRVYIESCEDKEELKAFIAEILAIKGNE